MDSKLNLKEIQKESRMIRSIIESDCRAFGIIWSNCIKIAEAIAKNPYVESKMGTILQFHLESLNAIKESQEVISEMQIAKANKSLEGSK